LETIYLTYIRPLLEYADVIWDKNITYIVDKIEKVQMEMVSTLLRNIQSEMFVISNLSYRGVIHKNVRMMRFVNITYLVDKIEKVQMEAARIVTVSTRLVSLNNLYLEIVFQYNNRAVFVGDWISD
jgi:hypothetical protein